MQERGLQQRVEGFRALLASASEATHFMEEVDGSLRTWPELSAEAKLDYLAVYAALYDLPFEPFVEAARDVLAAVSSLEREEAALRLVLRQTRELRELEMLFPDDGRTEPPPLVDRVKDALGITSLAELKASGTPPEPDRHHTRDRGPER